MPWISKRKIGRPNDVEKTEGTKRRNIKWNKYYQNKKYKKLRDWYMREHCLCQDCLFNGRSVPATELHHIRPISTGQTEEERMQLLMDWENNWVALCSECHDKRHNILKHNS